MQASNNPSSSIWLANASMPAFPALSGDTAADVCAIGAGETGRSV